MKKILTVQCTLPEAMKMAPFENFSFNDIKVQSKICVLGQHRERLDQFLNLFELRPDFYLNFFNRG